MVVGTNPIGTKGPTMCIDVVIGVSLTAILFILVLLDQTNSTKILLCFAAYKHSLKVGQPVAGQPTSFSPPTYTVSVTHCSFAAHIGAMLSWSVKYV
jgi:hypothetical protein